MDVRAFLATLASDTQHVLTRIAFNLNHFDSLDRDQQILFAVTGATLLLALIWVGNVIAERRLRRWCGREGFELLDWRRAYFFEGPRAWWRSKHQVCYRIEIRDHQGYERIGYVMFGSFWIGWPLSRRITVRWD